MDFVTVPLRRSDLAALRIMLRVLTVQRLMEAITTLRPKTQEQCSDMVMLTELLKYQDAHRTYDHHLLSALEASIVQGVDEIKVPMSPAALKFYQTITTTQWDAGTTIVAGAWTKMIDVCRKTQDDLHERLVADEKPDDPVGVNMKPAGGRN